MNILQLTWEYPPRIIGGISRVVESISKKLSEKDSVFVITLSEDYEREEKYENLTIFRVPVFPIKPLNFIDWVMLMNMAFAEKAMQLSKKIKFDIVHAHDWLCFFAAKQLKYGLRIPMVCTVHATEHGRNNGIHDEFQAFISSVEWWLCYEAWKVIVNSYYMKGHCDLVFSLPLDKAIVIPNGINFDDFNSERFDISFRRKYAYDHEKIIFFIGRHVYEKGVHILLEAFFEIVKSYNDVKLIVAGDGPMFGHLYGMAQNSNIGEKIYFTHFISDEERKKLYKVADVCVFPSIFEPFGIVALESMASGCATVVSDVGGFNEIIRHGENGMKFYSGNKYSLADNVLHLLKNPEYRRKIAIQGQDDAKNIFSWDKIVHKYREVYTQIIDESKKNKWFSE